MTAKWKERTRIQLRPLNQAESADHADDNPALSNVIERNIRTIIDLRLQAARARGLQDRIADAITAFSGRMVFVYAHIVWFGLWFVLNTGRFGVPPFDRAWRSPMSAICPMYFNASRVPRSCRSTSNPVRRLFLMRARVLIPQSIHTCPCRRGWPGQRFGCASPQPRYAPRCAQRRAGRRAPDASVPLPHAPRVPPYARLAAFSTLVRGEPVTCAIPSWPLPRRGA